MALMLRLKYLLATALWLLASPIVADDTIPKPNDTQQAGQATDAVTTAEPAPPAAAPPSPAEKLRKEIEAVTRERNVVEEQLQEFKHRQKELKTKLETGGLEEDPPYSILLLDRLRDELATEENRCLATDAAILSANTTIEQARAAHDEAERARRRAKEANELNQDSAREGKLAEELELATLKSRLAEETLKRSQAVLASEEVACENQKIHLELVKSQIRRLESDLRFSGEDLQSQLADLARQESEIERKISTAKLNQKYYEQRWSEARERYDATTENRKVIQEEVEAWRLARQRCQEELGILARRLQRITQVRTAWQRRYQVYTDPPAAEENLAWREEIKALLDQNQADMTLRRSQIDQFRKDLATLVSKREQLAKEFPEAARWVEEQQRHVQDLMRVYDHALVHIEATQRLYKRLLGELGEREQQLTSLVIAGIALNKASGLWNYELGSVDDRPITVGKIITAIALFVLGIAVSRLSSRLLERRLRSRSKINRDVAAALKTLTFYTLLIISTLFALRFVNVPLTVFTVLGGALAIGIGLGSQNLVNNFLSGLVIMAERPVRIGERILYGNYDGIVEEVAFRCTKIRTLTGNLVTVPNSHLINEEVENVGRRPFIRRRMDVTITYDTPRQKIGLAVEKLQDILAEPGIRERIHPIIDGELLVPRVYFNDLNADSLNIIVLYWFAPPDYWGYLEHSQKVNLRIMEEFERAGIDFAFPTQTLHLAGDPKRELAIGKRSSQPVVPAVPNGEHLHN